MREGTFSTTYYRGLWMGIYEEFIRFAKMLNYDTNVEIEFIIISKASCSSLFCVVLVRFGAI